MIKADEINSLTMIVECFKIKIGLNITGNYRLIILHTKFQKKIQMLKTTERTE